MIKFIDSTHQYLDENDKELTSVSAFVKSFQEDVDWKKIARLSAAKKTKNGNPTTQKELLDKWERKRNLSSKIGTLYHAIREQELINQNQPVFYDVPCEMKQCTFDDTYKYSIPINRLENNTVYPELMIYDEEFMICGQADKIIVSDNRINVWDYKTDAEIKFAAYSSKFVSPRKLLPPLSHLDDCDGNIYSLKMSLYMYMLWKSNKGRMKVGDIIIEHIHLKRDPDDDNLPILEEGHPVVVKIEQINLPYRKREVIDMLNSLKPI